MGEDEGGGSNEVGKAPVEKASSSVDSTTSDVASIYTSAPPESARVEISKIIPGLLSTGN